MIVLVIVAITVALLLGYTVGRKQSNTITQIEERTHTVYTLPTDKLGARSLAISRYYRHCVGSNLTQEQKNQLAHLHYGWAVAHSDYKHMQFTKTGDAWAVLYKGQLEAVVHNNGKVVEIPTAPLPETNGHHIEDVPPPVDEYIEVPSNDPSLYSRTLL